MFSYRNFFNWVLNTSKNRDSTTTLENPFQCFSTLTGIIFSFVWTEFSTLHFVPIASYPVAKYPWDEYHFLYSICDVFINIYRIFLNLFFRSDWLVPALSLPSHDSSYTSLQGICYTLLYRVAQNWAQEYRCVPSLLNRREGTCHLLMTHFLIQSKMVLVFFATR